MTLKHSMGSIRKNLNRLLGRSAAIANTSQSRDPEADIAMSGVYDSRTTTTQPHNRALPNQTAHLSTTTKGETQ